MPRKTPQKWQLATALDPTIIRIIPELAVEIGLNESIVLMQISFWIGQSNNLKDNTYWTFQSLRDMQKKAFPYWSIATIRRTVQNLADKGYILIGNYNSRKGDNTQWFALVPDKCSTLTSVLTVAVDPKKGTSPEGEVLQNETGLFQNDTPPLQNETTLPEIPTEIEKDISPIGDVEQVKPPNTKPKDKPEFDIVALNSFGLAKVNGNKEAGARIGKIYTWLKKRQIDAPRIEAFYRWYDRETQRSARPRDVGKFAEWFLKFEASTTPKEKVLVLDLTPADYPSTADYIPLDENGNYIGQEGA